MLSNILFILRLLSTRSIYADYGYLYRKRFSINDEIDRLRLRATSALVEGRRDVIVVASVSSIYSIGKKEEFEKFLFTLRVGNEIKRKNFQLRLSDLHYVRNDADFTRGTYRVRGDVIDIMPAYENRTGIRVEFFGDQIDRISLIDALSGKSDRTIRKLYSLSCQVICNKSGTN